MTRIMAVPGRPTRTQCQALAPAVPWPGGGTPAVYHAAGRPAGFKFRWVFRPDARAGPGPPGKPDGGGVDCHGSSESLSNRQAGQ
jgi:hypothetical protein